MAVQNIRIKYIVDTVDVEKADKSLDKLTESEKQLKNEFDKVNSSAKKSFDTVKKGADDSKNSLNNLNGTLKNIGSAVLAAFALDSVVSFGKKVIELTSTFQKYEAVLTNSLGSNKLARASLALLTEEAIRSNFSLSELTNGYIKLVNQGFKPTVNELRALQDLSNFTAKSFDQLIEAVLDAQQDQFIRLKDFGIKAKKEGEIIKFTFRENTTAVENTASAIRNYLVGLGKLPDVMGTTAAISSTLSGKLSNLGDNFDKMFVAIGQNNAGPLSDFIDLVNKAVDAVTNFIKGRKALATEAELGAIAKAEDDINGVIESVTQKLIKSGKKANEAREQARQETRQYVVSSLEETKNELNGKLQIQEFENESIKKFNLTLKGVGLETSNIRKEQISSLENYVMIYQAQLDVIDGVNKKEVKDKEETQKELDKAYKKELERLSLQESNALRQAKLDGASKEAYASLQQDLSLIQDKFNDKRIAAFRRFNQQNIDELKAFGLTELEIARTQVEKMQEIEKMKFQEEIGVRSELQLQEETNKQIVESEKEKNKELERLDDELNEGYKRFYKEDFENYELSAKAKRMAANELYQGLKGLNSEYASFQQAVLQNELFDVEQARKQELEAHKGNKQAEANVNARFDQESRAIKNKQAQIDKDLAIFNIGLNIAEGVVKALTLGPAGIPLAVVIGALGAAQLAFATQKPLPKFAKGVERLEGAGTETSDSILAQLSKGERVVTAQENKDYFPALHAIHNRHVPPELLNGFVMNYDAIQRPKIVVVGSDNSGMERELKSVSRKLDNLKQVNVNIDKSGVHAFLSTQNSNTELANNYIEL